MKVVLAVLVLVVLVSVTLAKPPKKVCYITLRSLAPLCEVYIAWVLYIAIYLYYHKIIFSYEKLICVACMSVAYGLHNTNLSFKGSDFREFIITIYLNLNKTRPIFGLWLCLDSFCQQETSCLR